jgi:hypothetical protein
MRFVGVLIVAIVAVVLVTVFLIVRPRGPRELVWDPTPDAEWYTVKCGTEQGRHTMPPVEVKAPSTSVPLEKIPGGSGTYSCVVTASNRHGESAPSKEIVLRR